MTLCRHDWAQQAGYTGRPVSIYLKGLAQNYEKVDTKEYEIVLLDTAGRHLRVNAIGLDALTQEVCSKDARRAYQRFPEVTRKQLERSTHWAGPCRVSSCGGKISRPSTAAQESLWFRKASVWKGEAQGCEWL